MMRRRDTGMTEVAGPVGVELRGVRLCPLTEAEVVARVREGWGLAGAALSSPPMSTSCGQ